MLLAATLATAGCTSTATVEPEARTALARTTNGDFVRLPTKGGGSVVFGPNATLHIDGGDGTTDVPAGNLYTNETGLFQRDGELVSTWDDLRSVKVEQLDGAATVAMTATIVVAVVAIAAIAKATSGSGSKGSSHGSSSHGSSHGSSSPRGALVRSPPIPSVDPDPAVAEALLRTAEAVASTTTNGRGGVTVTAPDVEPGPSTAIPLFSRGARRRANVRGLARLEGGVCWPTAGPNGDCMASGARAGLRLVDFIEVSAGLRVESDFKTARPLAVVGGMLHGEAPWAHWFALAIGASVAFDGTRAHVMPELALRFRPAAGLWIGLVPLEPMYTSENGGWTMVSGVELTGEL